MAENTGSINIDSLKKDIKQKDQEIEAQKKEIETQKKKVSAFGKKIKDSIEGIEAEIKILKLAKEEHRTGENLGLQYHKYDSQIEGLGKALALIRG